MTDASSLTDAALIPYVTPAEAKRLAEDELHCLLGLLASLNEEDWHKPTACTLWDVRDMVAHQAGAYASGTGYRELIHQYSARPKRGQFPEDSINEVQLADRSTRSPSELVAELAAVGDKAIDNWSHGFRLIKPLAFRHPVGGWTTIRHLMLVIHSRDTWVHRLDICRATGRTFQQSGQHDGRIGELVVRDLANSLAWKLDRHAVALYLRGIAGGRWRIGRGDPAATIEMDALDFHTYASGRFSYEEAAIRAVFTDDEELARLAFRNFGVMY